VVRLTVPGSEWHPVRLAREAFASTFQGSRDDLVVVTARRVPAALLLLWLTGRCVHLAQAGIDLAVGYHAYARPPLALGLAVACAAESVLIALVMVRARQLTLGALLADGVFGVVGLVVMSAAISGRPGFTGSLNWMLPYTVATAVGFGLRGAGYRPPVTQVGAAGLPRPAGPDDTFGGAGAVRQGPPLFAVQVTAVLALPRCRLPRVGVRAAAASGHPSGRLAG
jgi:hypothetical protein